MKLLTLHEGSADKDKLKKKDTEGCACAMRAAGLLNHEAAYTSCTAHYWYPSQTL